MRSILFSEDTVSPRPAVAASSPLRLAACVALSAVVSALSVGVAVAQDATWTGSTNSAWLIGTNWSTGDYPGSIGFNFQNHIATFNNNDMRPMVGINMNNAGNAFSLGRIVSSSTANRTIFNSSSQSGTLILHNTSGGILLRNTNTGNLTLADGDSRMPVTLDVSGSVSVTGTGNIVISSVLQGGGNITVTGNTVTGNDSSFVLSNAANTYRGSLTVASGRLRLDTAGALSTTGSTAGSNRVSVTEVGRLTFLNAADTATFGNTASTLTLNPSQTANPAIDIFSGANVLYAGVVALNGDSRIEVNGATGALRFFNNVSGSGLLIKQGAGTLFLLGANASLTGATQVGNGTINVASGSRLGSGALTLSQAAGNNTAIVFNNTAQSVGNLSSAFADATGTRTQTITLTGTALTVNQTTDGTYGAGAVSTLSSTIAGTGSLTKTGAATLTLTSNNTYTGTTTVSAGTLAVGANGTLGQTGTPTSTTVRASGTLTIAPTGRLNSNTLTNSGTITNGGIISGAGALTNSGTLNSSGTTGFVGGTNTGTINVTAGTTTQQGGTFTQSGSGSLLVSSGATFVVSPGMTFTQTAGTTTIAASGTLTNSGTTTINGGVFAVDGTVTGNALTVNAGGTLQGTGNAGALTLASGGTIAPGNSIGTLSGTNLTWDGGGLMSFELPANGAVADRISLSGFFNKGAAGSYTFNFNGTGGAAAQTFTLVSAGSTNFVASDFAATGLPAGASGSFAINGGDVNFNFQPVPAPPAALSLGIGGLVGLAGTGLRTLRLRAAKRKKDTAA